MVRQKRNVTRGGKQMKNKNNIQDTVQLNNGYRIPCLGFGTYKMPAEQAEASVREAIRAGYRHIDTAAFYGNEKEVGRAVRESGLSREDIFITSKVWNTDRGYEKTKAAFTRSLEALGTDYLDLYLIHWPANYLQFGAEAAELNRETWRAMEDLYLEGKVRAIGLSNFLAHHIEALLETARVRPAVDQIELHPGWLQGGILRYCRDRGILTEAWSPMGRGQLLDHPTIVSMAARYDKTPAQLCIRWVMEHGALPLPKTVTPSRIRSNTEVFDFMIGQADMEALDGLVGIGGQCARPDDVMF